MRYAKPAVSTNDASSARACRTKNVGALPVTGAPIWAEPKSDAPLARSRRPTLVPAFLSRKLAKGALTRARAGRRGCETRPERSLPNVTRRGNTPSWRSRVSSWQLSAGRRCLRDRCRYRTTRATTTFTPCRLDYGASPRDERKARSRRERGDPRNGRGPAQRPEDGRVAHHHVDRRHSSEAAGARLSRAGASRPLRLRGELRDDVLRGSRTGD